MPEGDAVLRLARTLAWLFEGQCLRVSSPQGRFASQARRIDGWELVGVRTHGKHMFLGFAPPALPATPSAPPAAPTPSELPASPVAGGGAPAGGPAGDPGVALWLHVHLGLYGQWRFTGDSSFTPPPTIGAPVDTAEAGGRRAQRWSHQVIDSRSRWEEPAPVGQVRVRLATRHGVADLSGPTRCELVDGAQKAAIEERLGPDPLAPRAAQDTVSREQVVARIRSSRRPVGELLMDQSVIAGVGNIYRAESLFLAGISPLRRGERVSRARLLPLWGIVCRLMERGMRDGRIVTVDPEEAPDPPLEGDREASSWYVYHRTGRPCLRCGTPIREARMQGRRLFWCPGCQR